MKCNNTCFQFLSTPNDFLKSFTLLNILFEPIDQRQQQLSSSTKVKGLGYLWVMRTDEKLLQSDLEEAIKRLQEKDRGWQCQDVRLPQNMEIDRPIEKRGR